MGRCNGPSDSFLENSVAKGNIYIQSSLDIPGFSGETKNARYIEGHGISRDPFSGAKFQSKSLNFYIFNAYC